MYSMMHEYARNYSLYQRLYKMFEELDRLQQYKVIRELIHCEFTKENYDKVVDLAIKHEKLITNPKDEIKETICELIGLGFKRNAMRIAKENERVYSIIADNAFKIGCDWTLRNAPHLFPINCINFAYWLYSFEEYKFKAFEQFMKYLQAIEETTEGNLFDNKYRCIEDAENALVSIMIHKIIDSDTPSDINDILSAYPKVVSAIQNSPDSEYYDDFIKTVELSKEICYGTK